MSKDKKVIIVGAGPGGLAAAMILSRLGYQVEIFEKLDQVGGRNSALKLGDFTFELGPTFVMLPQVFQEIFALAGKKMENYLEFIKIDPLYKLHYSDGRVFPVYFDKEKVYKEIERLFPEDVVGYKKFIKNHQKKFATTFACLKIPYHRFWHLFRWKLIKALFFMQNHLSVYGVLKKYFKHEDMRMAMSFQAKYLGMSAWDCPGAFSILSYVEHEFGIWHPRGGVHKISEAMAQVARENGVIINLKTKVEEIIFSGKKISAVKISGGKVVSADYFIINEDFAYAMKELVPESFRPSYSNQKIDKLKYSCSTFMIYLGLTKTYDLSHHNLIFSNDYSKNVSEIFQSQVLSTDPSIYIHNPVVTDPSLAPSGKSAVYILVPVPNLRGRINWLEKKQYFRDLVISKIKLLPGLSDLENYIEQERVITPLDWQDNCSVYLGATFNLAHNLRQMLYFRPHNRFNDIKNLYIVGGGTHPGSGLPTIIESGRIAAEMIADLD